MMRDTQLPIHKNEKKIRIGPFIFRKKRKHATRTRRNIWKD
jgi:hypothetical protein